LTFNKNHYIAPYRDLNNFTLFDLDLVRLTLEEGNILDWNQLNLSTSDAKALCKNHGLDLNNPHDLSMIERIRDESINYLKESFDFPIPLPVAKSSLVELLRTASDGKNRHRQFCACTLLKTMHIINHFDASEARQALKISDQELFKKAEMRIYRTVSRMMSDRLPIVEFMGGRKQRSSMVTKLLSKNDPLTAQLFDKMRFRIVTATKDDILPTINFLSKNLFPFNYILSGESYNTLFSLDQYIAKHPHLSKLSKNMQDLSTQKATSPMPNENIYSSPEYKVVHWVADMPVRINHYENAYMTDGVNPVPRPVLYIRAEIQILDRKTHKANERGHASHKLYKARQLDSVLRRLKVRQKKVKAQ
jgi:uncharacterized protein (TIGR04552 family)